MKESLSDNILEVRSITKTFPGVVALDDVSFSIRRGEVHGLVGENGAGKSTLMKILCGVYGNEAGQIFFDGNEIKNITPILSQKLGISIIFQEFNLLSTLSVAENIFVNRVGKNENGKIVSWKELNKRAEDLLAGFGYKMDVRKPINELSVAECQMVEIAKAMSYNAKLILMDEPSATLTSKELETLFHVIEQLKQRGITIVFISHKLDEVFQLCDTTTVMRDGKVIDSKPTAEYTKNEIVRKMVGREVDNEYPARTVGEFGPEVLRVEHLSVKNKVHDVSFSLRRGEILGIIGLVGAGRTELVRAIFGADRRQSGEIYVNGEKARIRNPREAIDNRIALLTEDRRGQGLFLKYDIRSNIVSASLKKVMKGIFSNPAEEKRVSDMYIDSIRIKCSSDRQKVRNLSGGNQQKVVVAKWMLAEPDVLIMDESTRGIDVGAKYEIYQLMNRLTEEGKSIIFISSEIQEVLAMSDRVIVLYYGRQNGEFLHDEIRNIDEVMRCAINQ